MSSNETPHAVSRKTVTFFGEKGAGKTTVINKFLSNDEMFPLIQGTGSTTAIETVVTLTNSKLAKAGKCRVTVKLFEDTELQRPDFEKDWTAGSRERTGYLTSFNKFRAGGKYFVEDTFDWKSERKQLSTLLYALTVRPTVDCVTERIPSFVRIECPFPPGFAPAGDAPCEIHVRDTMGLAPNGSNLREENIRRWTEDPNSILIFVSKGIIEDGLSANLLRGIRLAEDCQVNGDQSLLHARFGGILNATDTDEAARKEEWLDLLGIPREDSPTMRSLFTIRGGQGDPKPCKCQNLVVTKNSTSAQTDIEKFLMSVWETYAETKKNVEEKMRKRQGDEAVRDSVFDFLAELKNNSAASEPIHLVFDGTEAWSNFLAEFADKTNVTPDLFFSHRSRVEHFFAHKGHYNAASVNMNLRDFCRAELTRSLRAHPLFRSFLDKPLFTGPDRDTLKVRGLLRNSVQDFAESLVRGSDLIEYDLFPSFYEGGRGACAKAETRLLNHFRDKKTPIEINIEAVFLDLFDEDIRVRFGLICAKENDDTDASVVAVGSLGRIAPEGSGRRLRKNFGLDPSSQSEFQREKQCYENLIKKGCEDLVPDPQPDEKELFISMENLENSFTELSNLNRQERTADLALAIALAVDRMHQPPVVFHLDLKPSNIFVGRCEDTSKWTVKFIDFGCSTTTTAGTEKGHVGHTPSYSCPDNPRDGKTDVFALATMFSKDFGSVCQGSSEFDPFRNSDATSRKDLSELLTLLKTLEATEKSLSAAARRDSSLPQPQDELDIVKDWWKTLVDEGKTQFKQSPAELPKWERDQFDRYGAVQANLANFWKRLDSSLRPHIFKLIQSQRNGGRNSVAFEEARTAFFEDVYKKHFKALSSAPENERNVIYMIECEFGGQRYYYCGKTDKGWRRRRHGHDGKYKIDAIMQKNTNQLKYNQNRWLLIAIYQNEVECRLLECFFIEVLRSNCFSDPQYGCNIMCGGGNLPSEQTKEVRKNGK